MSEYSIERVTPADSNWISQLVNPFTEQQFGIADIIRLTEHSTISLAIKCDGVPVAFAAFSDQPLSQNWPFQNESSTNWDHFLHSESDVGSIFRPWNTLWLQYFVSKTHENEAYFQSFLTYIFSTQYQIHSILCGIKKDLSSVLPPTLFLPIFQKEEFGIYTARREQIHPALYVRSAVVEDTDDVTPLITSESTQLTSYYGDFVVAEMIQSSDTKNKFIVAEGKNNKACAFMAITTDNLDLQTLKSCFYLEHFSNFNQKTVAAIQIFAIQDSNSARSFDMLSAAFDQFVSVDYVIITVPKNKNSKVNSLLKSMVRVVPKTHSSFPHELFICHRDSILEDFSVRPVEQNDMQMIKNILANDNHPVRGSSSIMSLVNDIFENGVEKGSFLKLHGYVVTVNQQVVGLAVLRDEEDIEYLRGNFDIEKFLHWDSYYRHEHGRIRAFSIIPHFLPLCSTFLREIMRLSGKACLYKTIYEQDQTESFASCIGDLLPIMARKQIEYCEGELESFKENAPSKRTLEQQYPTREGNFSLLHVNKKLTMMRKIPVQEQIVVVGASDVAISFLKELIYQPHLCFTNLVLVSNQRNDAVDSLYSEEDIVKLGLSTWVNVVHGFVCELNRENRYVALDNGTHINYDNLVIATGLENTLSNRINNFDANLRTKNEYKKNEDIILTGLNEESLSFLNEVTNSQDKTPKSITLITNDAKSTTIPEPWMEKIVENLKTSGVKMIDSKIKTIKTLYDLQIIGVELENGEILNNLQSHVFYGFCSKRINPVTFRMLNDACLVMDGQLVIDNKFRTSDENIYAAGSCTKYARHYHTSLDQAKFNSVVIGKNLANTFMQVSSKIGYHSLKRLDPLGDLNSLPEIGDSRTKDFSDSAIKTHCFLPGGFELLNIQHVLEKVTDVIESTNEVNTETDTNETDKTPEQHLKIGLDSNGNVVKILAIRQNGERLCVGNLENLYGLHEKTIHNLKFRTGKKTSQNACIFEFLKTASLKAVYHDKFEDLLVECKEVLEEGGLENEIMNMLENVELNEGKREELRKMYENSSMKEQVEDIVTAWLSFNRNHLPMYARPGAV